MNIPEYISLPGVPLSVKYNFIDPVIFSPSTIQIDSAGYVFDDSVPERVLPPIEGPTAMPDN